MGCNFGKTKRDMKHSLNLIIGLLMGISLFALPTPPVDNPDAILGFWKTGEGNAIVQIYKQGEQYQGKIVWLKEPNDPNTGKPKLDQKNEDPKLKGRPIMGMINLRDFKYAKDKLWEEGKIYDPKSGEDYSCKITLVDNNTLEVRGYVGISLFGRTDTWKRQQVK